MPLFYLGNRKGLLVPNTTTDQVFYVHIKYEIYNKLLNKPPGHNF